MHALLAMTNQQLWPQPLALARNLGFHARTARSVNLIEDHHGTAGGMAWASGAKRRRVRDAVSEDTLTVDLGGWSNDGSVALHPRPPAGTPQQRERATCAVRWHPLARPGRGPRRRPARCARHEQSRFGAFNTLQALAKNTPRLDASRR
ncbi:MAG: hypothetical protein U0587_12810 [Candidatus Binatia bacterium]